MFQPNFFQVFAESLKTRLHCWHAPVLLLIWYWYTYYISLHIYYVCLFSLFSRKKVRFLKHGYQAKKVLHSSKCESINWSTNIYVNSYCETRLVQTLMKCFVGLFYILIYVTMPSRRLSVQSSLHCPSFTSSLIFDIMAIANLLYQWKSIFLLGL